MNPLAGIPTWRFPSQGPWLWRPRTGFCWTRAQARLELPARCGRPAQIPRYAAHVRSATRNANEAFARGRLHRITEETQTSRREGRRSRENQGFLSSVFSGCMSPQGQKSAFLSRRIAGPCRQLGERVPKVTQTEQRVSITRQSENTALTTGTPLIARE